MYTEAAAAELLRVAPPTLRWWLEGRLPRYRPVIRVEPTGSRVVTWAEFVEAGLLRLRSGLTRSCALAGPRSRARERARREGPLNPEDARTKRGQLEVFMTQWRRIEVSELGGERTVGHDALHDQG